ncbi:MAG: diaminopimelate epimerase [Oscillospiraceae bacterium]|nr:diaminopimelate epimerase [Oscillospiraceae bacterium]
MKFTKMHGCGNDYVYVDCTREPISDPERVSVQVSDRHFGIGADGLICICPSEVADFRMAMFNADGSEGAMCGNGIRCVAKFVYDKGLTDQTTITVETRSGVKTLLLTVEDGAVSQVQVDMGKPSCCAADIPVIGMGDRVIGKPVRVADRDWVMTCVSMGNPHAVVFVEEDPNTLDLPRLGPQFENHPMFPDRVNTEFIQVLDDHTLKMRVWERGSGETLACGTGACASVVASHMNGLTGREVTVRLLGGELTIRLGDDGHIYLTGPATTVFEGEIAL